VQGQVLELVSVGDKVQLVGKNNAGTWLLVITPRGTSGWVNASLLALPAGALGKLPVTTQTGQTAAPTSEAPTAGAGTPEATLTPSGLTAKVFNGGRIRSTPSIQINPSNQVGTINAGENVQLVAKTSDGLWYKITDMRGVTGWVSASLLTVPPDVASQVPVGQ
jgi:flagellar FliL protein